MNVESGGEVDWGGREQILKCIVLKRSVEQAEIAGQVDRDSGLIDIVLLVGTLVRVG